MFVHLIVTVLARRANARRYLHDARESPLATSMTAKAMVSGVEPSQVPQVDAFGQQDEAVERPWSVLLDSEDYDPQNSTGNSPRSSLHDKVHRVFGNDPSVLISIALTIVSCTVTSLGLTLQKLSHMTEGVNPTSYFLRLRWAFGLLVYIAGHMIGLVALGMGPQSILSGLNCWTLIMTFVYGIALLGEELKVRRVLSSLVCFVGSLILISARPPSAAALTAPEWFLRFGNVDFLIFLASICLVGCIMATFISVALRWALLAAALSWLSVTGAKGISGIAFSVNITEWQSLVLLAITVALAISNVHCLNIALQRGEITLIVPFYEMVALSGQVIVGGVFFKEFVSFHSILHFASFGVGLLLILCGLISIVGRENDKCDPEGSTQVDEKKKKKRVKKG